MDARAHRCCSIKSAVIKDLILGRDDLPRHWPVYSALAVAAIFIGAWVVIFETLPPRTIVVATGPEGDAGDVDPRSVSASMRTLSIAANDLLQQV